MHRVTFDITGDRTREREGSEATASGRATEARRVPMGSESLEQRVVDALRTVYDPELPVNIFDLGLIYGLDVDGAGSVSIRMTLTAPGCPVAQSFPATVEEAVRRVDGVVAARVELVWEPPWCQDRMTEGARLQLGLL